jgi:hypothetical protein
MPRSAVVVCAVSFVCAATLVGCARPAKAADTSASLTKRVSKGKCAETSGLPASAEASWTDFCNDLRSYLPSKFKTPSFATESRQTGEIGWEYTSTAVFTNKAGDAQTLTFQYDSQGFLGNRPKLTGVSSSIIAELVGQSVNLLGGWAEAVPSPEEAKLVEDVARLLSEQQCEQLQAKALQPLNGTGDTSFADACTRLNALFKQSSSQERTGYRTNQYSMSTSATPVTSVTSGAPQSTNKVSTAYFPEFKVQVIHVNGTWYLNGVSFEKELFQYKL